jgi:ATP-dependent helicase/nuclease subunit B
MPANLVLVPDLAAAFQHTNHKIQNGSVKKALSAAYVLLPTTAAIRNASWQLKSSLGVRLIQFYVLGEIILDEAHFPIHRLSDVSICHLVSMIMRDLSQEGNLTTFAKVWHKSGFMQVLIEWLQEVKSQGITPEEVNMQAARSNSHRDQQLAMLYQRYQAFLHETHTSDADGLLWLAAEKLEVNAELFKADEPFFVLGFDHFNPLQLRILKQIAARRRNLYVYLLWSEEHRKDSLALYRLARTREMLIESLSPQIITLEKESKPKPSLQQIREYLFELEPFSTPADQSVEVVAAPSRESEVRYAIRTIKKRLLDGILPYQIGLLLTDKPAYLPVIQAVSWEYGVPIQVEERLVEQPAITALINLLSLYPDFPWRQTMDALRSPCFRQPWLSGQQVDLLDKLTRQRPVVAGREQWSYALQPNKAEDLQLDDDERGAGYLDNPLSPEDLTEIERGLLAFFDHLTPPDAATIRTYVLWMQDSVIGPFPDLQPGLESEVMHAEESISLEMWNCCQENQQYEQRDLQAIVKLMEVLNQMVASLFNRSVHPGEDLTWEVFRDDLINLLSGAILAPDPLRVGVTCDSIHAARSELFDYTMVLGMSEGEFPRSPKADCLYSPLEREHHPLPILRFHPGEDACLWWQVISNCRGTLTMLRPYLDENGAEWQPSPYWDEVTERLLGLEVEKLPVAELPGIEQAASQNEILTALAILGASEVPGAVEKEWQAAKRAFEIIRIRQSWQPAGVFEGYLASEDILSELRARFGSSQRWSPSRLNSYGNCPYGFFAESVLNLEARDDPIDGLDAMQQGSLLHTILEELHGWAAQRGYQFIQKYQQELIERLELICEQIFWTAPERYTFRPSALWRYEQKELFRLLKTLVVWECESNGDQARFQPYLQEVRFGLAGEKLPALNLDDGGGEKYRVAGVIDRVDIDGEGNLSVIDYKSGSSGFSKNDLEHGLAFQTAIYASAVEPLLGTNARVMESAYLHIPTREKSGVLKFNERPSRDVVVQGILALAVEFIKLIQRGEFPSKPGKSAWGASACQRWCDFSSLCRVSRVSIAKAKMRREK